MRKIKLILSCILLFSSLAASAQLNRRNNTMTNDSETEAEKQKRKEYIEKEKAKNIEQTMTKLKNDLQLDELQFIAIKQIIIESIRTEGIILKKEESNDDKMKAIGALSETTDAKIKALLNKTQLEKFIQLRADMLKKKR